MAVPVRRFTLWQVVGGVVWTQGITLAGYTLGSRIPSIDRYLLPIIAVVVLLSLLPILVEVRRSRRDRFRSRGPRERPRPWIPSARQEGPQ